jgi:hypothetical protein
MRGHRSAREATSGGGPAGEPPAPGPGEPGPGRGLPPWLRACDAPDGLQPRHLPPRRGKPGRGPPWLWRPGWPAATPSAGRPSRPKPGPAGLRPPAPARSRATVEQRSEEGLETGGWKQQDQDGRVASYEPWLGFELAISGAAARTFAIGGVPDSMADHFTLGGKDLYTTHQKILNLIHFMYLKSMHFHHVKQCISWLIIFNLN